MAVSAALFALAVPAAARTACETEIGSCSYYACVSDHLGCGEKGYFRRFGLKYCRRFEKREPAYSGAGRLFLRRVRPCLQAELENETDLACANAEERAGRHHVRCYLENGYCDLPPADQARLQRTIFVDILSRPALWLAAHEISRACAP